MVCMVAFLGMPVYVQELPGEELPGDELLCEPEAGVAGTGVR